jgi:hypothetical protein
MEKSAPDGQGVKSREAGDNDVDAFEREYATKRIEST